ncbi:MAG TPA: hypothetical protein VFA03_10335 [Acetobacteraceae bacterium]|nr:hypothetical protein [Acetobacteraceae bacterium]
MRLAPSLLALSLLALPAAAQTAQTPPPAPPGTASAAAPAQGAGTAQRHRRLSLADRFEMANTTHDGRLTLDQAKASKVMRVVAKNFDVIDATHKGYVTEDDIRSWYKARRAARHNSAEASAKS